jgi:phage baseplate assembly protein W
MKLLKNIYSDIPMFFTRNIFTGDVNAKKDLLAIKESVKNIILTNTHERPFDSEFGTNATIGMFENINDFSFYVENNNSVAIALYETRVNLTNITSSMTDRSVSINIEYTIKNYDVRDNIKITVERTR